MAKKTAADTFFDDLEVDETLEEGDGIEVSEDIPEDEYIPPRPKNLPLLKQGRPMIIRATKVDSLTTIRRRVPLTKSMCRRQGCKYDAAKEMGFDSYSRVPPEFRDSAKEKLAAHVDRNHNRSEDHIVYESDLPTDWMGLDVNDKQRRFKDYNKD